MLGKIIDRLRGTAPKDIEVITLEGTSDNYEKMMTLRRSAHSYYGDAPVRVVVNDELDKTLAIFRFKNGKEKRFNLLLENSR